MERDLVTGGTGLVGSFLICELLSRGRMVRAMKRETSDMRWCAHVIQEMMGKPMEELGTQLEWVIGDVTAQVDINDAVEGVARVFHCAALVSFHDADRELLKETNAIGTANVVNACLIQQPSPQLCHFSSTATIGRAGEGEATEQNFFDPEADVSDYALSKYQAELEAYRGREEGLEVAIINPCIILGFGNWNQGPCRFFRNAYRGFPFFTNGANAFVDVRDVANSAIQLMDGKRFSDRYLCTSQNLTYEAVFTIIANTFRTTPPRIRISPWLGELAWRLVWLGRLFGQKPMINRRNSRSGQEVRRYNSTSLSSALSFDFVIIEEAIQHHCALYQKFLKQ